MSKYTRQLLKSLGYVHKADLIDVIGDYYGGLLGLTNRTEVIEAKIECLRWVLDEITRAPSIDIPTWIPCDKQLPKEGVIVLVCMRIEGHKFDWEEQRCIEFGRMSSDRYDIDGYGWEWLDESGTDFWEPDWNNGIVAWMPLPEPYKPEGADNEQA